MSSRNILLISPIASHPTISGNSVRPVYLAKQLRMAGYTPHFAYTDFGPGDLGAMATFWGKDQFHYFPFNRGKPAWEVKRIVRRLGLANTRLSHWWRVKNQKPVDLNRPRSTVDAYYDPKMTPWLRDLQAKYQFEAVIAAYVTMGQGLSAFPANIPKIIDTQEIFAVDRAPGDLLWIDIKADDEIRGLKRADYVWTTQQHEVQSLAPFLGDKVMTVSLFIDPLPQVAEQSLKSKNILFVGGNQPANVEAIRWFGKEIYPKLKSWLPPENVVVAGKVKNAVAGELPFNFLGMVPELRPAYDNSRLAICPVLSGTGLKTKNVEAFAFSKPVVTTAFGRLGMEDADNRCQIVADTPEDFAAAIKKLMTDDEACHRLMQEALAYANEWNVKMSQSMLSCLRK